jgi:Spy/CpxP family protein refolding chaperone
MQKKSLGKIVGGLGAAVLVTAGLLATVPHMAHGQTAPPPGDRVGRPGRGPGGRGGGFGGPMAGGALREIARDLTDAQREQVKVIRERHAEEIRPLAERSRAAREALNEAVFSGNTGNLQALSIEVGNAETEFAYANARIDTEVMGVLTAEQKQKLAERRKAMEARRGQRRER